MPSQQVIEKLEKLQQELETTAVAVKHIDEAAKVAKNAADILKKIPELLAELKSVEEKHRKDLQKDLKEKIDAIEKQLQSLLVELKDKTKQLSQVIDETKKLEKSITDYFAELRKINFPERLDKIDNQISSINIGVGNLQTAIQSTQTKVDGVQLLVNSLSQAIDKKFSDLENRIVTENAILKKDLKTSRIIQVIGFGLTLIILIYLIFK